MARLREVDVKLMDEVEFQNTANGKLDKSDIVTLQAPASKQRKSASKLSTIYQKAHAERMQKLLGNISEEEKEKARAKLEEQKNNKGSNPNDEDDEEQELTPEEIIAVMESSGADMDALYDAFQSLLADGCGHIGGIKVNAHIFDLFSYKDMQYLCGKYIADFLLQSRRTKKNGTI